MPLFPWEKMSWLYSKMIKTRFDMGRPPENLGCTHEVKKEQEKLQDRWHISWFLYMGFISETRWDMINLVGYRVFMTRYYMPSFHMACMKSYITVWICSPNGLRKLTDTFYLHKHRRTENHL